MKSTEMGSLKTNKSVFSFSFMKEMVHSGEVDGNLKQFHANLRADCAPSFNGQSYQKVFSKKKNRKRVN